MTEAAATISTSHIEFALQGPINCRIKAIKLVAEGLILAVLPPFGFIEAQQYPLPIRSVKYHGDGVESLSIQDAYPLSSDKAATLFKTLMISVVGPNLNNPKITEYEVTIPSTAIESGKDSRLIVSQAGKGFVARWETVSDQKDKNDLSYQLRWWIGSITTQHLLRALHQNPSLPLVHPNLDHYTTDELKGLLKEATEAYIQVHDDHKEASCQYDQEREEILDEDKRSIACVIVKLFLALRLKGEKKMPDRLVPYMGAIYCSVCRCEGSHTAGLDFFMPNW